MLKPEAENDPPDQLFLLSPAVIQKENIQVNYQPLLKFKLVIQHIVSSANTKDRVCVSLIVRKRNCGTVGRKVCDRSSQTGPALAQCFRVSLCF